MEQTPPARVVITGGHGFVGRYLVEELQRAWPKVAITIWDRQVAGGLAGVTTLAVDITKPETYRQALEAIQPNWVLHLAAIASVPYALSHPEETRAVNVDGTRWLLETIRAVSSDTKVLVVSSSDIYGGSASKTPLAELPLQQCQPHNPYAQSKLDMEVMVEKEFSDITIRVRPFPHIGPRQRVGFVTADFASQIAAIEKNNQTPTIKVGNLEAKRDFTDVRDVVRAYRLLMEKGSVGEVYNIASGKAVAMQDILDELLSMATVPITAEQDPTKMRPSDTLVIVGNARKITGLTGWQPQITLTQTLQDILDYWRKA